MVMVIIDNYEFHRNEYGKSKRIRVNYNTETEKYIMNNWFIVLIDLPEHPKRYWDHQSNMLNWLDNNIEEYYVYLTENEIIFSNVIDAIAFKLWWS